MKKTEIAAIAIILAIAALAWLGGRQLSFRPGEQGSDSLKPAKEVRVMKEDPGKTLAAFPAGFPAEAGAQGSGAYKYIPANSIEQQSTVEYVSQKTLTENAEAFLGYFNKAGFTVTNKSENSDLVFYYAQKGSEDMSVTIKRTDGKVSVSASYLTR